MRTMKLGPSSLQVPVVAVGCMRIDSLEAGAAARFVKGAVDQGANYFDHADIYGGGRCEEIFAKAAREAGIPRDSMVLQSKCGIRPGVSFDFSAEWITSSVEGILRRLNTDYLDVLLLHRPDALVEPEEVARVFDSLHASGKVRHFGVSNQNPGQIRLLQRYVRQPLVANQLQLSITNATMISAGLHVNMGDQDALDRDGGILDFCRLNDITIQPWSPFQFGFFEGVFLGNERFPELNRVIDEVAERHGVSATTIALAWILRHPARMQPVTGTTTAARLADCIRAAEVTLSREDWYAIFMAAGNTLP